MPKILAVERMPDKDLWTLLRRNVRWLANAREGEMPWSQRRALARQADEIVSELWLRGQQLDLLAAQGSESKYPPT